MAAQANSTMTTSELAVSWNGAVASYTMTSGTLVMTAGTPPGIVGGSASSLRIGDYWLPAHSADRRRNDQRMTIGNRAALCGLYAHPRRRTRLLWGHDQRDRAQRAIRPADHARDILATSSGAFITGKERSARQKRRNSKHIQQAWARRAPALSFRLAAPSRITERSISRLWARGNTIWMAVCSRWAAADSPGRYNAMGGSYTPSRWGHDPGHQ